MEESIFDTAGKQNRFFEKKHSAGKPQKETATIKNTSTYSELQEMLKKMREMKKDLEDQLSNIYEKGREKNLNPSLLVNDARDLTSKQLEKMEEEEKKLVEKINAIIPVEACLRKAPKSKEKLTQERSNKLRGARNNWLPMR